jgi:hypothetical protein
VKKPRYVAGPSHEVWVENVGPAQDKRAPHRPTLAVAGAAVYGSSIKRGTRPAGALHQSCCTSPVSGRLISIDLAMLFRNLASFR